MLLHSLYQISCLALTAVAVSFGHQLCHLECQALRKRLSEQSNLIYLQQHQLEWSQHAIHAAERNIIYLKGVIERQKHPLSHPVRSQSRSLPMDSLKQL